MENSLCQAKTETDPSLNVQTDAGRCPKNLPYSLLLLLLFFKLIPMSSFAIEYFILSLLTPQNLLSEQITYSLIFLHLFSVHFVIHFTISFFRPFPFCFKLFSHSFYEVFQRHLAQIYLLTIHPCHLFFYFIHFPLFVYGTFNAASIQKAFVPHGINSSTILIGQTVS